MRIINISTEDYANFSYHNAQALKSVDVDAQAFILKPHPFGYEKQADLVDLERIKSEIEKADFVQIMHSDLAMLPLCLGKPITVWHTGTRYRQEYEKINDLFNPKVFKSFLALGEFEKLGAFNASYVGPCIDVEAIKPKFEYKDKLTIGHFPSNPGVKGTERILKVIEKLLQTSQFNFEHSTEIVNHAEQLKRIEKCDIYVEMLAPEQGGKPYGSWGTTAIEAAALGKIVVTNNLHRDFYRMTYSSFAPYTVNDEIKLFDILSMILCFTHEVIINYQIINRAWADTNHSYQATGKIIKDILVL